jgi:transposase
MEQVRVLSAEFEEDRLVIDVAPSWTNGRCSSCGATGPIRDQRVRRWRHLDVGGVECELRYSIRRVECSSCGVKVEQVPWAEHDTGFTKGFEDLIALMAQKTDKTTVARLLRIAWLTVGRVIERVVKRYGGDPSERLRGLRRIGIDELSYRKHHRYVTVVVDLDTRRVVWVAEGKDAAALDGFFEALGPAGTAALKVASIDMSGAFKKALRERAPHVRVVFDRFHVQRLVHDALDEIRRGMVAELRDPAEKRALKGTRFALQRSPWKLDAVARNKLTELEKENQPLYRAYLMKESLAAIFDTASPESIHSDLTGWLRWVEAEGLPPLVKAAETIAAHFDGITAYITVGVTNAITEGFNRKARVVTSRAYGFKRLSSFAARGSASRCPSGSGPGCTRGRIAGSSLALLRMR